MGFVRDLTGKTAAKSAKSAGQTQQRQALSSARDINQAGLVSRTQVGRAGQQAGSLLDPFAEVGQQGLDQSGFLTDPQAQFDFLQSNPLFQLALDQANVGTQQSAAAQGRLSAGDTLQQLSNNVLLSAQPLIAQQRQSIGGLIDLGRGVASEQGGILQNTAGNIANIRQGTATNVANLQTGGAAAQAAGIVGAANARGARAGNILGLATGGLSQAAGIAPTGTAPGGQNTGFDIAGLVQGGIGLFSDENLKDSIELVGVENGHNIYKWAWNKLANSLGLTGESRGVIAQQVKETNPEAISYQDGFMKVNYEMIGVNHGN